MAKAPCCTCYLSSNDCGMLRGIHTDLTSVIQIASISSQDSHPRVRWAAIDLLEQLSKYLCPQLQNQHHQLVIPLLTKALLDFQNPRIQAHAASAISCFSQSCTSSILKPHLDVIMSMLLKLLQKGSQSLKEEALTALASLASSSQEHFQEYYVAVMPYIKVMSMQGKSNHRLLAKAMECITMIWMAVGKEICRKDCQEVVELLISLQESQMETDDPMRICILEVWGRLCKCLGKEFLPYMNVAMPHLLQSADVCLCSLNLLEEKASACNMLCSCAAELKEDFHLWIDEVADTLIPLLKFNLHQEVRMAAASAMPLILDSAKLAVEKGHILEVDESPVMKLSAQIIPAMTAALYMAEICARFLGSLNGCIQISGPYLTDNEAKFLMDEITKFLIARSLRRHAREQGVAQDSDAGERELLKEESGNEKEVYNNVGDCMATLIKRFKLSIVPFFEKLLICVARTWFKSFCTPFSYQFFSVQVDRTTIEKKLAVRIFHEVAEQCGEEALKQEYFLQVAAWTIGICAEFGGSFFKTIVDVALSSLNSVISHPNALQPDHVMVHDVAVSALGKICYFHYDNIKEAEVLSTWLSHLPITNLLNEAKVAHQYLYRVVERTKTEPLSVYLPSIIRVFAEILWAGSNLATAQTVSQMIGLLKNSKQTLPTEWASICSSLVPQRKNFLQAILSDT
uniref:Importin subunit beta-1/Transportin-1-like TPR repeats domain-containing protein n=1 Tax=Vitis vinifera TaxID=29760 RepID=F6HI02_VITVI